MAAQLRVYPAPQSTGTAEAQAIRRRTKIFPRIIFPCSENFEALSLTHERSVRRQLPLRCGTLRGHRTTGIGGVVPLRKLSEA